jgi:5-amino-6-(5-phosphoribosylamino)uracil reductase
VLVEGGPRLVATLVAEDLLDDLFLTLSPVLAGRRTDGNGGETRSGLLEGIELLPQAGRWTRLSSVKSHGSHLFLHYRLAPTEGEAPPPALRATSPR